MTPRTFNPILKAEDLFDSLDKEEKQPKQRKIVLTQ
jgi:hypothetical protein